MSNSQGLGRTLSIDFNTAIDHLTEALKTEGFGVLTNIDIQAIMVNKIGTEMKRYRILGTCNPPLAHRAITAEPSIGLLLPCSEVVRETGDRVRVEFMDPSAVLGWVDDDGVGASRQRFVSVWCVFGTVWGHDNHRNEKLR